MTLTVSAPLGWLKPCDEAAKTRIGRYDFKLLRNMMSWVWGILKD